jgi:hypothetical protein
MSHVNAALTPRHRLIVARLVVDDGWPVSEVAARFQVSWPTVKRWVDRYLAGEPMHATPGTAKNKWRGPKMGYAFVHTVIDDHSRVAYAEIHDDETANHRHRRPAPRRRVVF